MKKLAGLVFQLIVFLGVSAQSPSLSREVIASGGDFFVSQVGSLSWTLGEPVTETFENTASSIVLTQGFQQPNELLIDGLWELNTNNVTVNLYPNPASQQVILDINYDKTTDLQIQLVDMLGRLMDENKIEVLSGRLTNWKLNVAPLSNGMYMLRILDKGTLLNIYKFQKISN